MSYGPPSTSNYVNGMNGAGPSTFQAGPTPFSAYGNGMGSEPIREPLSLQQTLGLQLEWAMQGFWDAVNFESALNLITE